MFYCQFVEVCYANTCSKGGESRKYWSNIKFTLLKKVAFNHSIYYTSESKPITLQIFLTPVWEALTYRGTIPVGLFYVLPNINLSKISIKRHIFKTCIVCDPDV